MIKKWEVIRSQNVNSYRVFSTRKDISLSPTTGEEHDFYVVEAPDWVNVVAITPDDEIILIEQYRHGIRSITLEIPGGMVDDGESPLEAGKRELLEETGYESNEWVCIGKINPNPAIQNNACYTYLATNAKMVQAPSFEGSEDIAVSLTPSTDIMSLVAEGEITHALVVVAFYWYFLYNQHYRRLTDK
ncbi:MAG: NUDIX hydrolase [Candidatus Dadabacteria bacterium]|nr:NUDIX hydrolase [Candidatus Dadabacteria bacterium]